MEKSKQTGTTTVLQKWNADGGTGAEENRERRATMNSKRNSTTVEGWVRRH